MCISNEFGGGGALCEISKHVAGLDGQTIGKFERLYQRLSTEYLYLGQTYVDIKENWLVYSIIQSASH